MDESGAPWELVGGLTVFVHVEEASPEHAALTRDVDLMVRRGDLERIKEAAARHGFRFRHVRGEDMLMYAETDSARNAVHLVISGEKLRPSQATPNPWIAPELKRLHGGEVKVISVVDLVRMKLSSLRLKDQVHIQGMDAAGLITPAVEQELPADLLERLRQVRAME